MKILFVPKLLPYKTIIGGPIIIYNRIKYLSEKHKVGLASFVTEEDKKHVDTLTPYLFEVELVPTPPKRSFLKKTYDFCFSPVAPYFLNNYSKQMYQKVGEMVKRSNYDVVISEYSMAGQYLYNNPYLPGTAKRVISCHECYYNARKLAFRTGKLSMQGMTAFFQLKGLKKYEFNMYKSAHKVLTLTPEEKDYLSKMEPGLDISVVPHGVDIEYFELSPKIIEKPVIMFLGNYPHDPNRDAVIHFLNTSWPLLKKEIPDIEFLVVGKDPTPDIIQMAKEDSHIHVTGTVPDVREYLRKSRIFVNPVRIGSGFRGKILEAMAMGVPVVSTSLGAEGIPVRDGENILIADTPEEFCQKILVLMKDKDIYRRMRDNVRDLVVKKFSWQHGVEILEGVLKEVVGEKP